jgi:hypothetical protein
VLQEDDRMVQQMYQCRGEQDTSAEVLEDKREEEVKLAAEERAEDDR